MSNHNKCKHQEEELYPLTKKGTETNRFLL